ncbi:hypothetical protein [Nocardiopsis synnemataformans]|uniref:hypothetical protein n=1 Tax=Nocardiopsis synnemataformans TaxID=61305 RepID=UPI003EBB7CEF
MILVFTLVGLITGAAAMLPVLLAERRRRRTAEGHLALARAADPTEVLLRDLVTPRGAHYRPEAGER